MKIATRIALLQFQANPADPANLWRLILAWIMPGMREPREDKVRRLRADGEADDLNERSKNLTNPLNQFRAEANVKAIPLAIVLGAFIIAAVGLFVFRFEVSASGGADGNPMAFRLDRWTGKVAICGIDVQRSLAARAAYLKCRQP